MKLHLYTVAVLLLIGTCSTATAQEQQVWTLEKSIAHAIESNNLIRIRQLQIEEQESKIKEAQIKRYPALTVNSTYQYNVNVGSLTIPAGSIGVLPLGPVPIPMPNTDVTAELGTHNTFNAGVLAYQPLTQQAKIGTGIEVAKTEKNMATLELNKAQLQIKNGIEQLYYGILATRKRIVEAEKNIEVAQLKLYDLESALNSGKTIDANTAGLNANIASQEQELLKLRFQEEDYIASFRQLTGINDAELILAEEVVTIEVIGDLDALQAQAKANNPDIQLSQLQIQKGELAIKAAQHSNLPELGIIAGYTYQQGNLIFPENNPYAGINLKWNIQDLFSNKQLANQRKLLVQQAQENETYMRQQVAVSVEKAYRKLRQAEELIAVAQKAVDYRKQELKIEQDKAAAGLNRPINLLETEAALAKSEADLYGAQMSYKVAKAELEMLVNGK
ncbi:MAG TPA: TolC family protein [Flavobacteriales bacterium]